MYSESEFSKNINDIRQKEFTEKLFALLKEYKACIELEETTKGFYTDKDINIFLDGYRDDEADEYVSCRDVRLGNSIGG